MSGKHRAVRASRLGAVGVAAVGVLLAASSGTAVATVGTSSSTTKDCTDARAELAAAIALGNTDSQAVRDAEAANRAAMRKLDAIAEKYAPAKQAAADAAAALAKYDATHGGTGQPPVIAADRAALVKTRDDTAAALVPIGQAYFDATQAVYGPDGTRARLEAARKAQRERAKAIALLRAKVGQLCATDGKDGRDGIDARIVLSPGVCAEAIVQPGNVQRLIRVVTLIPCPKTTPPAPPAPPKRGDTVIVYVPSTSAAAPAPDTVETHLPVTH